jgi:hypothetical protein
MVGMTKELLRREKHTGGGDPHELSDEEEEPDAAPADAPPAAQTSAANLEKGAQEEAGEVDEDVGAPQDVDVEVRPRTHFSKLARYQRPC